MIRSSMRSFKLIMAASVAVVALVFSSATANAQACYPGSFTDVPPSHVFYSDITWLANEGITTGYSDCTFRPTNNITRQAMAAFLYRYAGEPAVPVGAPTFPDVPPSNPFYNAIRWLASEGIAEGYSDGLYRPANPITRQAMAAFLHRFAGNPPVSGLAPTFTDVPPSSPFYNDIRWMADENIAEGFPDGTYRPSRDVSRQAMAAFLHRYDTNVGVFPALAPGADLSAENTVAQRSAVEELADNTGVRLALVLPLLAGAFFVTTRRRAQA